MSISQVQSVRAAAVLEELALKLDLLKHTYSVQVNEEDVSPEDRDDLTKLINHCDMIAHYVSEIQRDLEESQTFGYLLMLVAAEEQRKRQEDSKMREKMDLEQQRELALLQEELQQKEQTLNEQEGLWITLTLQQKLQQEHEKDEDTKTQDYTYEIKRQHAEWKLEQQAKVNQEMTENEIRAHEEAKKFLQEQLEELKQKLEDDRQHTTPILQEKKQQLLAVSRKKTLALDKLAEMQRKFREMEQVVAEEKKEQEKLLQLEKKAKVATKIQAWWRGCMVRKGLRGPKKAEDGKKKKKGAKGKKKK